MVRTRWIGLLALALLLGCARETGFAGPGEACVRSTECMAGLACVGGMCTTDLSGLEGGMVPMPPMDAGPPRDSGMDAAMPPVDSGMDAGPPPPDTGPPPTPDSGPPDTGPPPMPDSGPPPMPDSGPPPTPDSGPSVDGG